MLQKLQTKETDAEKNFKTEDIKDEIFDMANPKERKVISLHDLYSCGQGDIILSILIDAKAFFDYDQREMGNQLNVDDDSHFEMLPGLHDQETPLDEEEEKSMAKKKGFGKFAEV